jgi:MFS transporter, PPP family, 3-phenylpropionic acid transporter
MPDESQIPIASAAMPAPKRFAASLALFYGAVFTLLGAQMPFFPVWLRAIGIDASWIGVIAAAPAVTRFTVLPFIASLAEKQGSLHRALIVTGFLTALGFALIGTQHQAILVFLAYAVTACMWTPIVPLTDAYALRGVVRYGLNYGPLRLWGSAAFVVGALACGLLVDVIEARQLIWVIAALAALGAVASLGLKPLDNPKPHPAALRGGTALLRDRGFLVIILSSALIQGSHAAFYIFSSITWQLAGFGGLTIAALWVLGVLAEIVVFALSPRFTLPPSAMVVIGALCALLRWLLTAQDPSGAVLAAVQLMHGLSFGLTQLGTMGLLVRQVPVHTMARGQGYLAACSGIIGGGTTILCGAIYARYGQGVYYAMAIMALSGAMLTWSARRLLSERSPADQPHNSASGG